MRDFEVEQLAQRMIQEHGLDARTEAANMAAKKLELRDFAAYEVWNQVCATIAIVQALRHD